MGSGNGKVREVVRVMEVERRMKMKKRSRIDSRWMR